MQSHNRFRPKAVIARSKKRTFNVWVEGSRSAAEGTKMRSILAVPLERRVIAQNPVE